MSYRSPAYQERFAHRQKDSSFPVPHTPPQQPPYHRSSLQMPLSSQFVPGYSHPVSPYQLNSSYQSYIPRQNHRVHASTAASPTPPASSARPSFSTRASSISEPATGSWRPFCVHPECNQTFASWSVLVKHEREKHVKRLAVCNRCNQRYLRKHRHPTTCVGVLSWGNPIPKANGYPCGWCERRFEGHDNWCKHIRDHQKSRKIKADWDVSWAMKSLLKLAVLEQAVLRHPQGRSIHRLRWDNRNAARLAEEFEYIDYNNVDPDEAVALIIARAIVPQNQFNHLWWAEPSQASSSSETQIPAHQRPVLIDDDMSVEHNLEMSPYSEPLSSPTSPSFLLPLRPIPSERNQQVATALNEFDERFSPEATVSGSIPGEEEAGNFELFIERDQNPLPTAEDYASSRGYRRASSHDYSRSSPSIAEENECAVPAGPLFDYVNPRLIFSDAGSSQDGYVVW